LSVIQATRRFPVPSVNDDHTIGLVAHVRNEVRTMFGLELVKALSGRGGIVGPVHEKESVMEDFLWESGTKTVTFSIWAHLTELPESETYRLLGGPADGSIVRTGGSRTYRVPVLPPLSAADPFDPVNVEVKYAEYEREGDTPVYLYRRVAA
jgi:hypothetical protein